MKKAEDEILPKKTLRNQNYKRKLRNKRNSKEKIKAFGVINTMDWVTIHWTRVVAIAADGESSELAPLFVQEERKQVKPFKFIEDEPRRG